MFHVWLSEISCVVLRVFSYHEGFGKWVEVGNSGMFRPEMLLPMGLPEDVRVIAWGLSLERYEKNFVFSLNLVVSYACPCKFNRKVGNVKYDSFTQ